MAGSNGFATWPSLPTAVDLRTTVPVYDTANRVTASTTYWDGTALVTSQTEYLGTKTISKPQIGSYQATTVDGVGRTVKVETYNGTTAPTATGLANPGAITAYSYSYNQDANTSSGTVTRSGWLTTTVTDDAGNQTVVVADLLGRTSTHMEGLLEGHAPAGAEGKAESKGCLA